MVTTAIFRNNAELILTIRISDRISIPKATMLCHLNLFSQGQCSIRGLAVERKH